RPSSSPCGDSSGNTITSNRDLRPPARTTESTMDAYGTFHVSNTQRVQPSSMVASNDRYTATRGASPEPNPGYPGVARGGTIGAESCNRAGPSLRGVAERPSSNGSVLAVTSYGRWGGPPGYWRRSG